MSYNIAIDGPAGAGKSTIAKRMAEKISSTWASFLPSNIGTMPVVNEMVVHLGMAKKGPMARYSKQVKK